MTMRRRTTRWIVTGFTIGVALTVIVRTVQWIRELAELVDEETARAGPIEKPIEEPAEPEARTAPQLVA